MTIYPQLIIDALTHVRYPGTGKDIVSSEILQDDIRIEGNKISFSLLFDKPNDPFVKSVMKAAEQAVLMYVGEDVDVKGNIKIKYKEVVAQPQAENALGDAKVLAVFSGKGGVGKSTISSNLAVSLAKLGYKVGLLDADIHGPSIPKMFGVEDARPEMKEIDGKQYILPVEKYGVKLLSIGFFVDSDNALVWRGGMASNALKQLITDAYWGDLDFFIIDVPPGTSDIHLTLVQVLNIFGVIIVSTPQGVALADARKGINMFTNKKINVPILGIVENMSWFTPAELPGNKYYIFGKEGGRKLAEEMEVPLLAQVPLVQKVQECGDLGVPAALDENSMLSVIFHDLAQKIVENN